PIRVGRLFQVYAGACDIARVGRIVRENLDRALKALQRTDKVIIEREGSATSDIDCRVARIMGTPAVVIRIDDTRKFGEIPPSEIGAVLAEVRRAHPMADDETIYHKVIGKYGISRPTRKIEAELKRTEPELISDS
ncbi:MAG: hypothetical protein IIB62_01140, partial [Proteobacteria bacterium]|nr:hypothetical protein [Pseudomonadota bacterium]